jgi:hypothetical protein
MPTAQLSPIVNNRLGGTMSSRKIGIAAIAFIGLMRLAAVPAVAGDTKSYPPGSVSISPQSAPGRAELSCILAKSTGVIPAKAGISAWLLSDGPRENRDPRFRVNDVVPFNCEQNRTVPFIQHLATNC